MKPFKILSEKENQELLRFPAYISLLAANSDGLLDETEKRSAIGFSHIKTYSCDPLLSEYYKEADRIFEKSIMQLDRTLPKGKNERDTAIKKELLNLEKIIKKLGGEYASVMHHSMRSFKEHVSKAHRNVLVDFIFPMHIVGLTD